MKVSLQRIKENNPNYPHTPFKKYSICGQLARMMKFFVPILFANMTEPRQYITWLVHFFKSLHLFPLLYLAENQNQTKTIYCINEFSPKIIQTNKSKKKTIFNSLSKKQWILLLFLISLSILNRRFEGHLFRILQPNV